VRLTGPVKTGAAMVATAAIGVSAASAFVGPPPAVVTPRSPVAQPGSDRIDQTRPDPGSGLDWGVRSYASTSGASCTEVGRMSAGRFGHIRADGSFEPAAVREGGTCGNLAVEPVVLAINHYPATARDAPRTVLFGRARPDVAAIRVTGPDGTERPLVAGAAGGFVLPLAGAVAPTALPVQVTLTDGQSQTFDWR